MTTYRSGSCSACLESTVVALVLIGAGLLLLLDNFGILWIDHVWNLWPLALIAIGVAELIHWREEGQS